MAESEGFEPPEDCSSTVFKTAAFGRSASSPESDFCSYGTDIRGPARLLAYYKHLPHGVIMILLEYAALKANTPTPSKLLMYDLASLHAGT